MTLGCNIILHSLNAIKSETISSDIQTGASLASALLCRWLREAGSTTVFASVVAIIE